LAKKVKLHINRRLQFVRWIFNKELLHVTIVQGQCIYHNVQLILTTIKQTNYIKQITTNIKSQYTLNTICIQQHWIKSHITNVKLIIGMHTTYQWVHQTQI